MILNLIVTMLRMYIVPIIIAVLVFYIFLGYKMPRLAIITMPFVATFSLIFSINEDLLNGTVLSGCIYVVTLLSIWATPAEADFVPWPKTWAKMILIILGSIVCCVGVFAVSGPLGGIAAGIIGLFIGSLIGAAATQRNATVAYVISTIGASMRQNLPLPMALQSAAENLKYKHARILRQISKWLVQGYSLSESIKRGFKNCPAKIVALIAAGEKIGQVPQVVQSIENDLLEKAYDTKRIRPVYPAAYFITVSIFLTLVVLGLMIGVMPKFSSVLKDMGGTEIPKSTKWLISISNAIAFEYSWLTLAIIGLLLTMSILYIRVKFRPRRPERPLVLSRIGDFIKWHVPVIRWFEKNNSNLQAAEVLRISLNAGNTINEAIRNTIALDVNYQFRKKLERWLKLVEEGKNPAESLRQCGITESLGLPFEQKSNPENTLCVLEMIESVYRSNYDYRVNLARFIILPCTTVMLGGVVGFVAYAIVAPMVELITVLSNFI